MPLYGEPTVEIHRHSRHTGRCTPGPRAFADIAVPAFFHHGREQPTEPPTKELANVHTVLCVMNTQEVWNDSRSLRQILRGFAFYTLEHTTLVPWTNTLVGRCNSCETHTITTFSLLRCVNIEPPVLLQTGNALGSKLRYSISRQLAPSTRLRFSSR
ncbi:hypothetical protein P171DRAFT_35267 [Karstenula rhodostoma CBS 690.94]|uniref:Uncharacterized protein n=1 Tax=Karstenula rhodostoma CBS 690.94 TaxID=1392251 RepID=A0A9P4PH93_9PLEO|nr:hypothetical protein P171DRAFT_35267 [Karstenula rhodostoma CBS 690.94]